MILDVTTRTVTAEVGRRNLYQGQPIPALHRKLNWDMQNRSGAAENLPCVVHPACITFSISMAQLVWNAVALKDFIQVLPYEPERIGPH